MKPLGCHDDKGTSRSARDLFDAVLRAQELERERIARDLHDSTGQNLSAVKLAIEAALRLCDADPSRCEQVLEGARDTLRETIDELRRIALNLRPASLDDLGLLESLEGLCREFRNTNPGVDLVKNITLEEHEVPAELCCDLYRLVQEALHNVVKHASASRVVITLSRNEHGPLLCIEDNGCGFDVAACEGNGIGLGSMRARAERDDGRFHIHSRPGNGARIEARWVLPSVMPASHTNPLR